MSLNQTFMGIVAYELKKRHITIPQAIVLDTIKDRAKTIGDISKAVDLSYSTVSGIIDRLERQELVERFRDVSDKRVVFVRMTEKCLAFHSTDPFMSPDFFQEIFKGMTKEEEDRIVDSLSILQNYLEEHVKLNV
ncbi:MarR family transcriptional regulator [Ammoniphilus sp. CFH 90114]|nr:MarR family transcriptional regulator [Ammoniphilus sp. CFH 90114]